MAPERSPGIPAPVFGDPLSARIKTHRYLELVRLPARGNWNVGIISRYVSQLLSANETVD